jgi:hypothetical protein
MFIDIWGVNFDSQLFINPAPSDATNVVVVFIRSNALIVAWMCGSNRACLRRTVFNLGFKPMKPSQEDQQKAIAIAHKTRVFIILE